MLDKTGLDKIIEDTLAAIENGKKHIFEIAENTRLEHNRLKEELNAFSRDAMPPQGVNMEKNDALTGLYNFRGFLGCLRDRIVQCKFEGRPLGLLIITLNNLQKKSNGLGQIMSELMVKQFSVVIANSIRKSDTACRTGPLQFVVIAEEPVDRMEIIRKRISENISTLCEKDSRCKRIKPVIELITWTPLPGFPFDVEKLIAKMAPGSNGNEDFAGIIEDIRTIASWSGLDDNPAGDAGAGDTACESMSDPADASGDHLLQYKRVNLEGRVKRLENTLSRAENLASQLAVVNNYLNGGIRSISGRIDEIQQMQQLGVNIIKAQEEERRRLARDIHDGPAQIMANIVMRAEFCLMMMDVDSTKAREELVALQHLVRQSLQDVRKIIFDLRPMVLDDLGLVPALKKYVEDFAEQCGIAVELNVSGIPRRLPNPVEVAVFRVCQESLNNIRKHSQAGMVTVRVDLPQDRVNVIIKDDGKGFVINRAQSKSQEGFGLMGMRERIQMLNGELAVKSAPGRGTTVKITVPIQDPDLKPRGDEYGSD